MNRSKTNQQKERFETIPYENYFFGDKMIHNRKRNRLSGYDYATPRYYFVTICTKGMMEHFGCVQNNEMELNDTGLIVQGCWLDLPNHYKNCNLHAFVIIPNHIHGIIENVGNGFKPFQNKPITNKRNCSLRMVYLK